MSFCDGGNMEKLKDKSKKNNWLKRFIDYIGKDTSGKNESKKVIIVVRILVILYTLYITANMIICTDVSSSDIRILIFYGIFFLLFIGIFRSSYHYKTLVTLWLFNISTVIWVVCLVHYFGWNIGVQHFLMLLVIMYFFSSYRTNLNKILFAVCICTLRIILFYLYNKRIPVWELSVAEESLLQMLNTITIFGGISVISYIFSKDGQEMEGKLIEYNNQLEKQANTDALTGLFNRRKAIDYMNTMIKNIGNNQSFCLCICDIDFFKKVNDNYGHDFGDLVLKRISEVFREEMQGKNMVARWGGEEFLLLFPDCNGDDACIKLEKIRRHIKETKIEKENFSVSITMTFGVAEYNFSDELDVTLKEADQKLYIGKEKGRDIIIF